MSTMYNEVSRGFLGVEQARDKATFEIASRMDVNSVTGSPVPESGEVRLLVAEVRDALFRLDRELGELQEKLKPVMAENVALKQETRPEMPVFTPVGRELVNSLGVINQLSDCVVGLRARIRV